MTLLSKVYTTSKKRLSQHGFLKNVIVLAGGTAAAQIITIVSMPIITRLYSPEDMGILSVYMSFVAITLVVASFRYELAILLPKEDDQAINLLAISLALVIVTSTLLLIFFVYGASFLVALAEVPDEQSILWLVSLGVLAGGIYKAISYWYIRTKNFKIVAQSRFIQTFSQVLTQIVLGVLGIGYVGLLLGDILGRLVSSSRLVLYFLNHSRAMLSEINREKIKKVALVYRRFPIFSSFSGFINVGGVQITPILLVFFYDPVIAGLFALAQRVIGIPLSLVGNSVGDVYFSTASKLTHQTPARLISFFRKMVVQLFLIGSVPIGLVALLSPYLVGFLFGEEWAPAGRYLQVLAIMHLGKFVASALSQTLNILERQDLQLGWDVGRFILAVASLFLAYQSGQDPLGAIMWYSVSMFIAYILQLLVINYALHKWGLNYKVPHTDGLK